MPFGPGNPYNGNQSPLEYYAINGNTLNGGLGRTKSLNATTLYYGQSFKNPVITSNPNDQYSSTHTNAISDAKTPYRGKGTSGFLDITNQNGGDDFDRFGANNWIGSGRYAAYANNLGTWGYDYQAGHSYTQPNTSLNIGQVII